jgi:hypothetical protein
MGSFAYHISRGGKYVDLRIDFINPKSINFSSPRMEGSCPLINTHRKRLATKNISSKIMTRHGVFLCNLRLI